MVFLISDEPFASTVADTTSVLRGDLSSPESLLSFIRSHRTEIPTDQVIVIVGSGYQAVRPWSWCLSTINKALSESDIFFMAPRCDDPITRDLLQVIDGSHLTTTNRSLGVDCMAVSPVGWAHVLASCDNELVHDTATLDCDIRQKISSTVSATTIAPRMFQYQPCTTRDDIQRNCEFVIPGSVNHDRSRWTMILLIVLIVMVLILIFFLFVYAFDSYGTFFGWTHGSQGSHGSDGSYESHDSYGSQGSHETNKSSVSHGSHGFRGPRNAPN